jgi:hypothetical protein
MESRAMIRVDYPDDDLRQRITRFLGSLHFQAFRNLAIDVRHGAVTLSGNVCSYYEKQVALSTCQRVAGVLSTVDRINVEPSLTTEEPDARNEPTPSSELAAAKPR